MALYESETVTLVAVVCRPQIEVQVGLTSAEPRGRRAATSDLDGKGLFHAVVRDSPKAIALSGVWRSTRGQRQNSGYYNINILAGVEDRTPPARGTSMNGQ